MADETKNTEVVEHEAKPEIDPAEYDHGSAEDEGPLFGKEKLEPEDSKPTEGTSSEDDSTVGVVDDEVPATETSDEEEKPVVPEKPVYFEQELIERAKRLGFTEGDVRATGDPNQARALIAEIELRRLQDAQPKPETKPDPVFESKLDAEVHDGAIREEFDRLHTFHADRHQESATRYSKLEETVRTLQQSVDSRNREDSERIGREAVQRFDKRIEGLDQSDVFGNGPSLGMANSPALDKRNELGRMVQAINQSYQVNGGIDEQGAFDRAYRALYAVDIETKTAGEIASQLETNKAQVISRPTGRKAKSTITPMQKAEERTEKFFAGGDLELADSDDVF